MDWSGWDEGNKAVVARLPQELMVAWTWWCQGGERLILGLKVEPTGVGGTGDQDDSEACGRAACPHEMDGGGRAGAYLCVLLETPVGEMALQKNSEQLSLHCMCEGCQGEGGI